MSILSPQRGFTLFEFLGALTIASMMTVGLASLINTSQDDTKGQQTALYQSQVAAAAAKYINDNYQTIVSTSTPTTPYKISLNNLTAANYLSTNFSSTNSFGQTPCILVLQPAPNKLDTLIVTEGGDAIPDKDLAYIAANTGQGGGFIPASTPLTARGASNAWTVNTSSLASYLSTSCSGNLAASGHLATAQFYDGPGLPSDFLYRSTVAGHPELNDMQVPLGLKSIVKADDSCSSNGTITRDVNGAILSCQSGTWQPQSGFWKNPVADYSALTALPSSQNAVGDTRLILDKNLGFTWDGTTWKALAIDQNNLLTVDELLLNNIANENSACPNDGLIARDTYGAILSCSGGIWGKPSSDIQLGNTLSTLQQALNKSTGIAQAQR